MRRLALTLLALLLSLPALAGVNINTADALELDALPGIGPDKAAEIVRFRDEHGPFAKVEDVGRVPGIGPATLTSLADLIHVGDGKTVAAPVDPPGPPADAVYINHATAEQLDTLPGIGPAKAQSILDDLERGGPYATCDDLVRVNGIGPATVKAMGDHCQAGEPPSED